MIDERLLHRVQRIAVGETLDGEHFAAFHFGGQRQAGGNAASIDMHRMGSPKRTRAAIEEALHTLVRCTDHIVRF
jgi:hypothetical protein